MVFAAPNAMWLYCTGTVFRERGKLLTAQKREQLREIKPGENQKSIEKEEQGGEFREIIKREGGEKINKQTLWLSLHFYSCRPTLSPFLLVLHFRAWSPLKWMTV